MKNRKCINVYCEYNDAHKKLGCRYYTETSACVEAIFERKKQSNVKKLIEMCTELLWWMTIGDFDNGVEYQGMNQGRIQAKTAYDELYKKLEDIKKAVSRIK